MKKYELGIEPLPHSPLLGLHIEQCEAEFKKKWHPIIIISLGFFFFTISFKYVIFKS